jgi:hypothetical protein
MGEARWPARHLRLMSDRQTRFIGPIWSAGHLVTRPVTPSQKPNPCAIDFIDEMAA